MATADKLGVESVIEVVTQTFQIDGELHGDELKGSHRRWWAHLLYSPHGTYPSPPS